MCIYKNKNLIFIFSLISLSFATYAITFLEQETAKKELEKIPVQIKETDERIKNLQKELEGKKDVNTKLKEELLISLTKQRDSLAYELYQASQASKPQPSSNENKQISQPNQGLTSKDVSQPNLPIGPIVDTQATIPNQQATATQPDTARIEVPQPMPELIANTQDQSLTTTPQTNIAASEQQTIAVQPIASTASIAQTIPAPTSETINLQAPTASNEQISINQNPGQSSNIQLPSDMQTKK